MSKISDLIAKFCPNGVEYKRVCDVFTRLRGTPITATKMKEIENPDGDVRIFAGGKTAVFALESEIPNANVIRVPAVLVQSRGVIDFIFYDKPFTFKNEMWAYTADEVVSVKFLYYVLQSHAEKFREAATAMGAFPQISLKVTEEFLIPVPPLEVQREVVEVLDKFALLTAELTAELEKRKKQYEHYRDKLLEFTPPLAEITIFDACEICRGRVMSKKYLRDNAGEYPVFSSQTANGGVFGCISTYDFDGEYVTWTTDGANAGSVFYHDGKFSITNVCGLLKSKRSDVLIKFVFYWLQVVAKNYVSSGMGNPKLMSNVMGRIKIPLPPLAEQERIVKILDKFDKLCNDLASGLPAEIAARKKQYEYYRDKLLNFPPSPGLRRTSKQEEAA